MVDEVDLGGEFFRLLVQFDERITLRVAAEGCPWCDGPLHRGDYARVRDVNYIHPSTTTTSPHRPPCQ